jgi:hypothetical protein
LPAVAAEAKELPAVAAEAKELPAVAAEALGEYTRKRADVLKRTDGDIDKLKQALQKKLVQQEKRAANDDEKKQIAELLAKVNGPAFQIFEIEEILKKNATAIPYELAKQLNLQYMSNRMTVEDWNQLPAVTIDVKANTQTDTTIDVKKGEKVVVCPHPGQKWRKSKEAEWYTWNATSPHTTFVCTSQAIIKKDKKDEANQDVLLGNGIIVTPRFDGRLFVGDNIADVHGAEGVMSFKIFRMK